MSRPTFSAVQAAMRRHGVIQPNIVLSLTRHCTSEADLEESMTALHINQPELFRYSAPTKKQRPPAPTISDAARQQARFDVCEGHRRAMAATRNKFNTTLESDSNG